MLREFGHDSAMRLETHRPGVMWLQINAAESSEQRPRTLVRVVVVDAGSGD